METGNPKQVAALAVAAVAAVGFLLSTLGKGGLPKLAQGTGRQAEEAGKAPGHKASFALLTDPFSHPRLAAPAPAVEKTIVPSERKPLAGDFDDVDVALPMASEIETGGATTQPMEPEAPKVPKTPKPAAPTGTSFSLEAVMGASDAVAFLSVEGGESRPYRPGDRIKGTVRLLRIEEGAVVVSGPKGELTLGVGERKRI